MSHYIDMETGEIIDLKRFRQEQRKIEARTFLRYTPRLLFDGHYSDIMGVLCLIGAVLIWLWWS